MSLTHKLTIGIYPLFAGDISPRIQHWPVDIIGTAAWTDGSAEDRRRDGPELSASPFSLRRAAMQRHRRILGKGESNARV
jgi:hypothetical protein